MKFDMSKYVQRYNGIIPDGLRGVIKGNVPKREVVARKGGDITNAKYAAEHGITKRQASKQRRGY